MYTMIINSLPINEKNVLSMISKIYINEKLSIKKNMNKCINIRVLEYEKNHTRPIFAIVGVASAGYP